MGGEAKRQSSLFSNVILEPWVQREHSLRKMRVIVDAVLMNLNECLEAAYAKRGRLSVSGHLN